MSTVIFVKLSAATFSAAVALIWLTSSDVWEIGNVNCDAAVSLCQSGHHQWHLKLIFPSLGGHWRHCSLMGRERVGCRLGFWLECVPEVNGHTEQEKFPVSPQRNLLGLITHFILFNKLEMRFNFVLLHAHTYTSANELLPRLPYVIWVTEKQVIFEHRVCSDLKSTNFSQFCCMTCKKGFQTHCHIFSLSDNHKTLSFFFFLMVLLLGNEWMAFEVAV